MERDAAERMAKGLMDEHGLSEWTFIWCRSKVQSGKCDYNRKHIGLSRLFVDNNDESIIRNTILHEIAHALCPIRGHCRTWREMFKRIGGDGKRLNDGKLPTPKYVGLCPICGKESYAYRRVKRTYMCGRCHKTHGEDAILTFIPYEHYHARVAEHGQMHET